MTMYKLNQLWLHDAGIRLFSLFIAGLLLTQTSARGALILRSYDFTNHSSAQDGAVLSGSFDLLIDTTVGGTIDNGGGEFILFPAAVNILNWNFTVAKPGQTPYSASSTDNFQTVDVSGSAFRSTPTSFTVGSSTSLSIGINDPNLGTTSVNWNRLANLYNSGFQNNDLPRGWLTPAPTMVIDANNDWIVGDAIPEPSSAALLLGVTAIAALFRRRGVR